MYDILPQSINANRYYEQLDMLVTALREKRRRTVSTNYSNIHFLHYNARPHTANQTMQKLRTLGFNILPHPPYSPDLAPSNYYLFSAMKSAIRGKNYNNVADIQLDINNWIESKDTKFFYDVFAKLPGRRA